MSTNLFFATLKKYPKAIGKPPIAIERALSAGGIPHLELRENRTIPHRYLANSLRVSGEIKEFLSRFQIQALRGGETDFRLD